MIERRRSPELVKFLVSGGISYVINQVALVALYEYALTRLPRAQHTMLGSANVALLAASTIALEISMIVRFTLNDRWTFRARAERPLMRRFVEFNFGSLASPIIALLAVNMLTPLFGVPYLVSNSIGIVVGLGWNWMWCERVVWRREAAHDTPAAAPAPVAVRS